MRPGPPKFLEKWVGIFIPPARRDDVLGDLFERYTNPLQYLAGAAAVVPFVILGQILRTTDWQVLFTEALLLYASSIAAAWYGGKALLSEEWGVVRLAIPASVVLVVLIVDDAWSSPAARSTLKSLRGVAVGVGLACLYQTTILPLRINLVDTGASLLLISSVRMVLAQPNLPQGAGGPALWPNPITQRAGNSSQLRDFGLAILVVGIVIASMAYLPQFRKLILGLVASACIVYVVSREI